MRCWTQFAIILAILLVTTTGVQLLAAEEPHLVLRGNVFDAINGKINEDHVIVIRGERIDCAGSRAECSWPDGAPVRRLDSKTILPGLIDLHAHPTPDLIGMYIPAGVTTIRDAGNTIAATRAYLARDQVPRTFAAGPRLDGPDTVMAQLSDAVGKLGDLPLEDMETIIVATPEEASEAVRALVEAGMDWIKLYEKLEPEVFQAAVNAAHRLGARTAGDIGLSMTRGVSGSTLDIIETARMGLDSNEHHSGLALAYQRRGGDPTSTDLDDELLDAIADEIMAHLEYLIPTLLILSQYASPDDRVLDGVPGAELAKLALRDRWNAQIEASGPFRERAAADVRLGVGMLQRLHEAGIIIGCGTDAPHGPHIVPGGAVHQEMELLVRAGLSPPQALQAATWNAARILGRDELGHLGTGAIADIVVVSGNPTEDIRDTRRISHVWVGGEEIDLDAAWKAAQREIEAAQSPNEPE